jgi:hypothetical protein
VGAIAARRCGDVGVLPSRSVTDVVYTGNARIDGEDRRGWILGHFMPVGSVRRSADVEIRWATHQRGDRRADWVAEERRTTAIILISGRFTVRLPGRTVVLAQRVHLRQGLSARARGEGSDCGPAGAG